MLSWKKENFQILRSLEFLSTLSFILSKMLFFHQRCTSRLLHILRKLLKCSQSQFHPITCQTFTLFFFSASIFLSALITSYVISTHFLSPTAVQIQTASSLITAFSKILNPWMCKSYDFCMYSWTISNSIKKNFYRSLEHTLKVWSSIPWICHKHASLKSLKWKKRPIINTTENKCHWNDCMMYFLVKIAPINYSRRNFRTQ